MNLFVPKPFFDIRDKLAIGQRLDDSDALRLFECGDLNMLGQLADEVNRRKKGANATYIINRYLNYSNY